MLYKIQCSIKPGIIHFIKKNIYKQINITNVKLFNFIIILIFEIFKNNIRMSWFFYILNYISIINV